MATAMMNGDLLARKFAYFKDTLLQIQCHNYNLEYEKVPHAIASLLIGDLKRILRCAVFLKENRIPLLAEELDLPSRFELHECVRKLVNVSFEYKHFHGEFTISHVGHYPDLVSIAAHVNIEGFDQSILGEDVIYEFPQNEPDIFKYLPFLPKAHSTPNDKIQE